MDYIINFFRFCINCDEDIHSLWWLSVVTLAYRISYKQVKTESVKYLVKTFMKLFHTVNCYLLSIMFFITPEVINIWLNITPWIKTIYSIYSTPDNYKISGIAVTSNSS